MKSPILVTGAAGKTGRAVIGAAGTRRRRAGAGAPAAASGRSARAGGGRCRRRRHDGQRPAGAGVRGRRQLTTFAPTCTPARSKSRTGHRCCASGGRAARRLPLGAAPADRSHAPPLAEVTGRGAAVQSGLPFTILQPRPTCRTCWPTGSASCRPANCPYPTPPQRSSAWSICWTLAPQPRRCCWSQATARPSTSWWVRQR